MGRLKITSTSCRGKAAGQRWQQLLCEGCELACCLQLLISRQSDGWFLTERQSKKAIIIIQTTAFRLLLLTPSINLGVVVKAKVPAREGASNCSIEVVSLKAWKPRKSKQEESCLIRLFLVRKSESYFSQQSIRKQRYVMSQLLPSACCCLTIMFGEHKSPPLSNIDESEDCQQYHNSDPEWSVSSQYYCDGSTAILVPADGSIS